MDFVWDEDDKLTSPKTFDLHKKTEVIGLRACGCMSSLWLSAQDIWWGGATKPKKTTGDRTLFRGIDPELQLYYFVLYFLAAKVLDDRIYTFTYVKLKFSIIIRERENHLYTHEKYQPKIKLKKISECEIPKSGLSNGISYAIERTKPTKSPI